MFEQSIGICWKKDDSLYYYIIKMPQNDTETLWDMQEWKEIEFIEDNYYPIVYWDWGLAK